MSNMFGLDTYGEAVAEVYDTWAADDPESQAAAVNFLAELAGPSGSALELGIGTGRIALPLTARGIEVTGVEASEQMVAQLRGKPGGAELPVVVGDMAEVPVRGVFDVVYLVASTLYGLTDQQTQLRCVTAAALRLAAGGRLVVEAFVPDPSRFDRGQRVQARAVDVDGVRLDVTRHDPVTQTVVSQQIAITADGIRLCPVRLRYIWPSELDLMAKLAGLRLVQRSGGWRGEPFTAESGSHVCVYQAATA
jgi:SAM-dependent methyltransferase